MLRALFKIHDVLSDRGDRVQSAVSVSMQKNDSAECENAMLPPSGPQEWHRGGEIYLWSSVSGSTKMFSCASFTRRNTKESRQGSGTAGKLEHMQFSLTVSGNKKQNKN